jgi:N-acetylglucosamine transport system permease protein
MSKTPGAARKRGRAFAAGSQTLVSAWSAVIILPLLWTLMSSFKTTREILASPIKPPARWSFDNYVSAWQTAGIGEFFGNTVIVVGFSVVLVMALGAMCAYALATFSFPGRGAILNVFVVSLAFPMFLAIVPLYKLLRGFQLLNTLPGLIALYVAFALPFTVFFLESFFKQLPRDIYEAAQIDGASEWGIFFRVMLPMALPGLGTVGMFNFVGLWNQYLLPLIVVSDRSKFVLTQGMAAYANVVGRSINLGSLFAAVVITILPVLLAYVLFQRRLAGSVSQGTFR